RRNTPAEDARTVCAFWSFSKEPAELKIDPVMSVVADTGADLERSHERFRHSADSHVHRNPGFIVNLGNVRPLQRRGEIDGLAKKRRQLNQLMNVAEPQHGIPIGSEFVNAIRRQVAGTANEELRQTSVFVPEC